MSSQQMRQRIQSEFRRQQLMLDKEALARLVEYVEQAATGLDAIYTVIEKLEAGTRFRARPIAPIASRSLNRRSAQTTILESPGH